MHSCLKASFSKLILDHLVLGQLFPPTTPRETQLQVLHLMVKLAFRPFLQMVRQSLIRLYFFGNHEITFLALAELIIAGPTEK